MPSVTELLQIVGIATNIKDIPKRYLNSGTKIHKQIEQVDACEYLPELDPVTEQYKKWAEVNKPEILFNELKLERGGISGRVDKICKINGEVWIIDNKTTQDLTKKKSNKQLNSYYAQMGGYQYLYEGLTRDYKPRLGLLFLSTENYELLEVENNLAWCWWGFAMLLYSRHIFIDI